MISMNTVAQILAWYVCMTVFINAAYGILGDSHEGYMLPLSWNSPTDVVVAVNSCENDATQYLYVIDRSPTLFQYTLNGVETNSWSLPGSGSVPLILPNVIFTLDCHQNVFYTWRGATSIYSYNLITNSTLEFLAPPDATFDESSSIAVGGQNDTYLYAFTNTSMVRYTVISDVTPQNYSLSLDYVDFQWPNAQDSNLATGYFVDASSIYVDQEDDEYDDSLLKFTLDGNFVCEMDGLDGPVTDVSVDADGIIYILLFEDILYKYSPDCELLSTASVYNSSMPRTSGSRLAADLTDGVYVLGLSAPLAYKFTLSTLEYVATFYPKYLPSYGNHFLYTDSVSNIYSYWTSIIFPLNWHMIIKATPNGEITSAALRLAPEQVAFNPLSEIFTIGTQSALILLDADFQETLTFSPTTTQILSNYFTYSYDGQLYTWITVVPPNSTFFYIFNATDDFDTSTLELTDSVYDSPAFCTDPDKSIIMASTYANHYYKFNSSGHLLWDVDRTDLFGVESPNRDVKTDSQGNIYVATSTLVCVLTPEGEPLTCLSSLLDGTNLTSPSGIWLDKEDRVFVATDKRIYVFEPLFRNVSTPSSSSSSSSSTGPFSSSMPSSSTLSSSGLTSSSSNYLTSSSSLSSAVTATSISSSSDISSIGSSSSISRRSSSSGISISSSSSSSFNGTEIPDDNDSEGLGTSAIIAISVCGSVLAIAIVVILIYCVRKRRLNKETDSDKAGQRSRFLGQLGRSDIEMNGYY